jgi:hypothetical protein
MNRPSTDCLTCHSTPRGGLPAVVYTNDLSCGDASCHGKVKNHVGTSISAAACTTCHTAHYESLGTCSKCHADPQSYHHGTATAVPLTQCATCHDGSIATAEQGHAGQACATCHAGMARPPVPATCQNCHMAKTFGSATCTACHSKNGMIGKETIHALDPAATVSCTTCHTAHFADLGTCDSCHASHAQTHHATVTLTATKLGLKANPRKIKSHSRSTLSGRLRVAGPGGLGLASQSILIQRRMAGGAFKNVGIVTTGADGTFSRRVKPGTTTQYRAVWIPAGAYATQDQPAVITATLKVRK